MGGGDGWGFEGDSGGGVRRGGEPIRGDTGLLPVGSRESTEGRMIGGVDALGLFPTALKGTSALELEACGRFGSAMSRVRARGSG